MITNEIINKAINTLFAAKVAVADKVFFNVNWFVLKS